MTYNPPTVLSFNGTVVSKKNKNNPYISKLYISPDNRITVVEDNKVSSIKKTNTRSVVDKLKNGQYNMVVTVKDSSKKTIKVCKIVYAKSVKMNGAQSFKLQVSHDSFDSLGSFAYKSVTQFNNGVELWETGVSANIFVTSSNNSNVGGDCENGYMNFPLDPRNPSRRTNGISSFPLAHSITREGPPVRQACGLIGVGRLSRITCFRLPCAQGGQIPDWPSCSQGNCPPGATIG